MKTYLKTRTLYIFSVVLALFLSACIDKEEEGPKFVPMSAYLKNALPTHQTGDKMYFIGNYGDTVSATVNLTIKKLEGLSAEDCNNDNGYGCIEEYYQYILYFGSSLSNVIAKIELFSIRRTRSMQVLTAATPINLNNTTYTQNWRLVPNSSDFTCYDKQICHSSITINNQVYYDVLEYHAYNQNPNYRVFYSKTYGIIRIQDENGWYDKL